MEEPLNSIRSGALNAFATHCLKLPEVRGDRKVTVGVGKWW
jgi:hypothetical protein